MEVDSQNHLLNRFVPLFTHRSWSISQCCFFDARHTFYASPNLSCWRWVLPPLPIPNPSDIPVLLHIQQYRLQCVNAGKKLSSPSLSAVLVKFNITLLIDWCVLARSLRQMRSNAIYILDYGMSVLFLIRLVCQSLVVVVVAFRFFFFLFPSIFPGSFNIISSSIFAFVRAL